MYKIAFKTLSLAEVHSLVTKLAVFAAKLAVP